MGDKTGDAAKSIHRIIKGEKLLRPGRHGDSCHQQPKRKEEDKLGKQGGSHRAAQRERRQAWDTRRLVAKSSSKKEIKEEGEKLERQGGSCSQKPKRGMKKGGRLGRQAWGTRRQPRAAQKGNEEGRQASGTRQQRQPRAAQKANHEGRQAWGTRRQRQPGAAQKANHETNLGDKAAARQPRAAQKGNPEWRQAWGTRPQRQPRAAQKANHEGRQTWETRRPRQPRAAQKGNPEGRQG